MKTIYTKYVGPTNTKGSRIIASDRDGNRVIVSYRCEWNTEENHIEAARKLCRKMDWHGELIGSDDRKGMLFVWNRGNPHFTV